MKKELIACLIGCLLFSVSCNNKMINLNHSQDWCEFIEFSNSITGAIIGFNTHTLDYPPDFDYLYDFMKVNNYNTKTIEAIGLSNFHLFTDTNRISIYCPMVEINKYYGFDVVRFYDNIDSNTLKGESLLIAFFNYNKDICKQIMPLGYSSEINQSTVFSVQTPVFMSNFKIIENPVVIQEYNDVISTVLEESIYNILRSDSIDTDGLYLAVKTQRSDKDLFIEIICSNNKSLSSLIFSLTSPEIINFFNKYDLTTTITRHLSPLPPNNRRDEW